MAPRFPSLNLGILAAWRSLAWVFLASLAMAAGACGGDTGDDPAGENAGSVDMEAVRRAAYLQFFSVDPKTGKYTTPPESGTSQAEDNTESGDSAIPDPGSDKPVAMPKVEGQMLPVLASSIRPEDEAIPDPGSDDNPPQPAGAPEESDPQSGEAPALPAGGGGCPGQQTSADTRYDTARQAVAPARAAPTGAADPKPTDRAGQDCGCRTADAGAAPAR